MRGCPARRDDPAYRQAGFRSPARRERLYNGREMALLISAAGSVIGTLIVAPLKWLSSKIRGQPSAQASDHSIAAGRDVTGQVAMGDHSTIVSGQGVAVGGQAGTTIVIVQAGAAISLNTNASVRTHELQSSGLPAVRDPYGRGIRLQEAGCHEDAIREFEKAFAAAPDERARASIHIQIGISLMSLSRLTEAEGHFREADQVIDQDRRTDNHGKK